MGEGPSSLFFFLARRFLSFRPVVGGNAFLVWISWISLFGIALGVMALVVVMSVVNGFEGEIARAVIDMNGHALLYTRGDPFSDLEQVEAKIHQYSGEKIEAMTPVFVLEAMISGDQGAFGTVIQGVDFPSLVKVTAIQNRLHEGRFPDPFFQLFGESLEEHEVVLGVDLAEKLGAKIGSSLRLVVPMTSIPIQKVKVVGMVRLGMHDYDSQFLWMNLQAVQAFLKQKDRVTHFHFRLKPGISSLSFARGLSEFFGYPFRAKDWSQLNQNLFYAIQLEKFVIALLLLIILIVASFNVVSTLMILIHEKSREIAILKAMGLRRYQIFWLFSGMGLGMGGIGVLLGAGVALGLLEVLSRTQLIRLSAAVYSISFLPVVVRPQEVLAIVLGAWCLCWLATLYPACQVSRQSVLEGFEREALL